ncbi:MAG TPA: hypothetical protein VGL62_06735 [Vicinamibacterales bacterium]
MPEPVEVLVELRPSARFAVIDARRLALARAPALADYPHALYSSFHTTAGYFEQGLASRLRQTRVGIEPYVGVFRRMFPEGAGYWHDDLDRRTDLSPHQRSTEPRNADAHLAFIASGMTNCADYVNRRDEPVYFVDLDGIMGSETRRRLTSVVGFHQEAVVARDTFTMPMSPHPIDSVSLKDERLGLYARIQELVAEHGVGKGRVHLTLAAGERHAALTINEYEMQLMRGDLVRVLHDPLRLFAEGGRDLLADPWAIPNRTLGCAKYGFVRVCDTIFDRLRISESLIERGFACVVAAPARRFLRMKRAVSLLVADRHESGRGALAEGLYQCPILVQWAKAENRRRTIDVTLTRLS